MNSIHAILVSSLRTSGSSSQLNKASFLVGLQVKQAYQLSFPQMELTFR